MSAKTKSVLRPMGTATIPASETLFEPNAALVTRKGLYVWGGFIDRVRKHAAPVQSMGALALPYSDLVEAANDREIGSSLGKGYEFSATKLCYVIDRLVSAQPNGEDGVLLNNGYANLFYDENGPVANLYWSAGSGEWGLHDWDRGVARWLPGYRAFRN